MHLISYFWNKLYRIAYISVTKSIQILVSLFISREKYIYQEQKPVTEVIQKNKRWLIGCVSCILGSVFHHLTNWKICFSLSRTKTYCLFVSRSIWRLQLLLKKFYIIHNNTCPSLPHGIPRFPFKCRKKSWKDWDSDQHLNTPFKNQQEMITNEKFQILLIQENTSSFDNQLSHGINTSIFSSR